MSEGGEEAVPQQAARRLMVVEDDPDTAELLLQQLDRDGFQMEVARNGQEAILKTGESPPDLIIMDVMMPKLDGFETSRFMKAKFRGRYVPILVLTAKGDGSSLARGARLGCEEYLTKPYVRRELVASVEQLLALGDAENALRRAEAAVSAASAPAEGVEAEGAEVEAAPAAPSPEEVAELRASVLGARLDFAERLIVQGRPEIARVHLERAQELDESNERARALLAKLSLEQG